MRLAHAKRRDANERPIIDALEAIGCSVIPLDPFDLLVGRNGVTHLIEVKNPAVRWRLTDSQKGIIETWRGSPLHVVTTVDEAMAVVNQPEEKPDDYCTLPDPGGAGRPA